MQFKRAVKLVYMYRDASNWKQLGSVVFGTNSDTSVDALNEQLVNILDEDKFFVAHKSGVPELFPDDWNLNSPLHHGWHEASGFHEVNPTDWHPTKSIEDFMKQVCHVDEEYV